MSKRLLSLLHHIEKLSDRERRRWITLCDKELIGCLSECSKKLLQGNVPLSKHEYEDLCRHKWALRQLSLKKTPLAKKRKILLKAGLIDDMLTPVLKFLSLSSSDDDDDDNDAGSRDGDSTNNSCSDGDANDYDGGDDDDDDDVEEEEDDSSPVKSTRRTFPGLEYISVDDHKTNPERPYTCAEPGCGAAYPYLRNLCRHIKIKHHRHVDGRPASPLVIERAKASSRHRVHY